MKFSNPESNVGDIKFKDHDGSELVLDVYRDTPRDDPKNTYHFVVITKETTRGINTVGLTRDQGRDLALAIIKELSR